MRKGWQFLRILWQTIDNSPGKTKGSFFATAVQFKCSHYSRFAGEIRFNIGFSNYYPLRYEIDKKFVFSPVKDIFITEDNTLIGMNPVQENPVMLVLWL